MGKAAARRKAWEIMMDAETRAELLTLRALLLLTLGELANLRPDAGSFLEGAEQELVRALSAVRIQPDQVQAEVRERAVAFARDWFTHIHFRDENDPVPKY
jgi:hypothetical protein